MENPRGVSSSLPGHMCTVVLLIIINFSIKSPFSYREDSSYLIITMTIYQNIMISTFQGPCETLPGQTNFTCKVSLLQRTWFVLSYLARYIYVPWIHVCWILRTYVLIVIQFLITIVQSKSLRLESNLVGLPAVKRSPWEEPRFYRLFICPCPMDNIYKY